MDQIKEKKDTIGGLRTKIVGLEKRLENIVSLDIKPGTLCKQGIIELIPKKITVVNVRYNDGYLEVFECFQVRQGGEILWMRLTNGQNRTIPLMRVRWFSTDPESHASQEAM
jgi:hypothetical protein